MAQIYISIQHPCKISTENNNFSTLCKEDKFLTRICFQSRNLSFLHRAEKLLFSVKKFHECSLLTYVCVKFFSDFLEVFSYFLNFKKHSRCICTREPKWISGNCVWSFLNGGCSTSHSNYMNLVSEKIWIFFVENKLRRLWPTSFVMQHRKEWSAWLYIKKKRRTPKIRVRESIPIANPIHF